MKIYALILSLFLSFNFIYASEKSETEPSEIAVNKLLKMEIGSSINPATLNYLDSGFQKANSTTEDYDGILIIMNTPGGLVSTTKKILNLIGKSRVPVIIWIAPEGSSATSAGAIISSGAHLLYMSEGTNIGAATPVQLGKDIDGKKFKDPREKDGNKEAEEDKKTVEEAQSDLRQKAINDLVALVTSLAKSRGRNVDGFAEMISKASSFDAQSALKKNLIDGIVNKETDIKDVIDGKIVHIQGTDYKINTSAGFVIEFFEMDLGQSLLNVFADPSLAYILFLIGAALIYFELQAPGGFIAGSIGVVFIVMAGIGFQVLPLNFGGLGLILLSFVLFILEVYITSYGILSIAGLASLVTGSLFLFRTNDSYLELSTGLIFSATGAIALFLGIVAYMFIRDNKYVGKEKFNEFEGKMGRVTSVLSDSQKLYQIKIGGEFWKARSEQELEIGQEVTVTGQNKEEMYLIIG